MTIVREISERERDYWNREIQRFEVVHPLNAFEWGMVRKADNWTPVYLVAERNGDFCGGMMILKKKLPFTPFTILYGQKAPVWDYHDNETLIELVAAAVQLGRKEKAIFLRIDPNIPEVFIEDWVDKFLSLGFRHLRQRWTFWNSPRDVYRINLTKFESPEQYFNLLDRDTRRCIRKATKEGVTVEVATNEDQLREFYRIFRDFSMGKGFMSRGYEYQKRLWDSYITRDMGRLFLAKYEGKIIGGLICIMFGKKCLAMHMGTPYQYHKLQTYYAYLWESIKWAKGRGCSWYSFRGVGTTSSQEFFKSKFLPEVVSLMGYYDYPGLKVLYPIFYWGEFQALPRAWPFLVGLRKAYRAATRRLKIGDAEWQENA